MTRATLAPRAERTRPSSVAIAAAVRALPVPVWWGRDAAWVADGAQPALGRLCASQRPLQRAEDPPAPPYRHVIAPENGRADRAGAVPRAMLEPRADAGGPVREISQLGLRGCTSSASSPSSAS